MQALKGRAKMYSILQGSSKCRPPFSNSIRSKAFASCMGARKARGTFPRNLNKMTSYAAVLRNTLKISSRPSALALNTLKFRGHSFITYAQIPVFQTHPPTLYAQIMTSLWQQYIGVRMALDPLRCVPAAYVINERPLSLTTLWLRRKKLTASWVHHHQIAL